MAHKKLNPCQWPLRLIRPCKRSCTHLLIPEESWLPATRTELHLSQMKLLCEAPIRRNPELGFHQAYWTGSVRDPYLLARNAYVEQQSAWDLFSLQLSSDVAVVHVMFPTAPNIKEYPTSTKRCLRFAHLGLVYWHKRWRMLMLTHLVVTN